MELGGTGQPGAAQFFFPKAPRILGAFSGLPFFADPLTRSRVLPGCQAMPTPTNSAVLLYLRLHLLLAATAVAAATTCNSAGAVHENTCFVAYFPRAHFPLSNTSIGALSSADACCSACAAKQGACESWQWIHVDAATQPKACFLFRPGASPKEKVPPKHPAQSQCDLGYFEKTPPPPPPPSSKIKNVLYILVDDLRTEISPYGHSAMHTPHLQAFAKSPGTVLFEQAHVQSQMCVPTRNSFMSGRRPNVTKVSKTGGSCLFVFADCGNIPLAQLLSIQVFNDGIGEHSFRVVGRNWTALPQHFKNSGWFSTGSFFCL